MAIQNAALVQPQRLTTAQRNAIQLGVADVGRFIYNTDDNQLQYFDGTDWVPVVDADSDLNGANLTGPIDAALITTGELDGGAY